MSSSNGNGNSPNLTLLAPFITGETTELDLGDYAQAQRGRMLTVYVNHPGIESQFSGRAQVVSEKYDPTGKVLVERTIRTETEPAEVWAARQNRVVALLFGLSPDDFTGMSDDLRDWLYVEGFKKYQAYHKARRDFLPAPSASTSDWPASPPS